MELFVLLWLVFGFVVAIAARERGHNPATWFVVSILISSVRDNEPRSFGGKVLR